MLSKEQMWDIPIANRKQRGAASDGVAADAENGLPDHIPHLVGNTVIAIIKAFFKLCFRFSVTGIEHVRSFLGTGQGAVVVSNHSSFADVVFLLISAWPKQWIRFIARENMFNNAGGLAGQIMCRVGAIPIKRDTADRNAIKRASTILKGGELVGIFPEGTRRGRGTKVASLHGGAAFIARMGKAPIIPSTVRNCEKIKPKGQFFFRFPKVEVEFAPAVYLDAFDFLPKADRLDGATWYVMRECYALYMRKEPEEVPMMELFPDSRDFSSEFAGVEIPRGFRES